MPTIQMTTTPPLNDYRVIGMPKWEMLAIARHRTIHIITIVRHRNSNLNRNINSRSIPACCQNIIISISTIRSFFNCISRGLHMTWNMKKNIKADFVYVIMKHVMNYLSFLMNLTFTMHGLQSLWPFAIFPVLFTSILRLFLGALANVIGQWSTSKAYF